MEVYTIWRIYKTWVLFVERIYMVGGELRVHQEKAASSSSKIVQCGVVHGVIHDVFKIIRAKFLIGKHGICSWACTQQAPALR